MVSSANSSNLSYSLGSDYSKVAILQRSYNLRAAELLSTEISKQFSENPDSFMSKSPYNIADLGCADGINSIPVIKSIIQKVREINPNKEISIYLNDIPQADINKAMANVSSAISGLFHNICVYGTAKSFYTRIFPDLFLDLVFSMSAIHFLSQPAPAIIDYRLCYLNADTGYSANPPISAEIKKWIDLGESDWLNFIKCREAELKSNGRLYVGIQEMCPDGSISNKNLMEMAKYAKMLLREKLKKFGWEKYELNLTYPIIIRREEHFKKPFIMDPPQTNLKWQFSEYQYQTHPIYAKLKENEKEATEELMKEEKSYTLLKYKTELESKKEDKEKIKEFCDEFFEQYATGLIEIIDRFLNNR